MKLGSYEVLSELGRGGAGVVYRARSPEGRAVAVKLLRRAALTDEAFARFERERRLQESLGEAEGFVPLLDAGTAREGPFLVMPLVDGGTLRQRLHRGPLGVAATLELGLALARAVGRAHERAIVHRDLKPENVIFTSDGRPLVADLGLAKHFHPDAPGASQSVQLSRAGELRGTAGYMPLEQMRDARSAGPAADVFALGAILLECLSGEPAFAGDNPIIVLARVEAGLARPVRAVVPGAPPWLAAVIERALALEPGARFPDGGALARALEAGPPARAPRGAALALALLVAAGAGGAFLVGRPGPLPPPLPLPLPLPTLTPSPSPAPVASFSPLVAGFERTRTTRLLSVWGRYEWSHAGNISCVQILPDGKRAVSTAADGCLKLWEIATGAELRSIPAHEGVALVVAVSPDGRLAATGGNDATLRLWDLGTGAAVATVASAHPTQVSTVAFSHDGRRLLSGGHGDDTIRLWDVADLLRGERAPRLELHGLEKGVTSVTFLPDDERAVSTGWDGKLRLWTLATGEEVRDFASRTGFVNCSAISPDGRRALSAGKDPRLQLWDLQTGELLRTFAGHTGSVVTVAFSPDGRRALSGGSDKTLRLWDLGGASHELAVLLGHTRKVKSVAFAPDGQRALTAGTDQSIRLWDLAAAVREEPCELEPRGGHQGAVEAVAFLPDGRALTAGFDETLRLWDPASGRQVQSFAGSGPFLAIAVAPDGRHVLASGGKGVRVWNLATGKLLSLLEGKGPPPVAVAFLADEHRALTTEESSIRLWDVDSGKPLRRLEGHTGPVRALAVLAGGRRAVSGSEDGTLRLWELDSGLASDPSLGLLGTRGPPVTALAALPDGEHVLVAARGEPLGIRDLASGTTLALAVRPHRSTTALAISPDGRLAAASGEDGTIHLLALPGGDELDRLELGTSSNRVRGLAFDGAGKELLVGTARGVALRFALGLR